MHLSVAATQKHAQKPMWPWPLSMTLKFSRVLHVVEVHVHAKFHQAKCSSSWVIMMTKMFALSHNGEKSENPVLWRWFLTYDLVFNRFLAVVKVYMFTRNFIKLSAAVHALSRWQGLNADNVVGWAVTSEDVGPVLTKMQPDGDRLTVTVTVTVTEIETVTCDLRSKTWKLEHRLLLSWRTLAPIFVFVHLFAFDLGARTWQTDRRTDRQADRMVELVMWLIKTVKICTFLKKNRHITTATYVSLVFGALICDKPVKIKRYSALVSFFLLSGQIYSIKSTGKKSINRTS